MAKSSNENKKTKSLADTMREFAGEDVTEDQETEGVSEKPESVLPEFIENSTEFKKLPKEEQERLRKGGAFDPDADAFEKATDSAREEAAKIISELREKQGLDPITKEELDEVAYSKPDEEEEVDDDSYSSIVRNIAKFAGEDVDDDDDESSDATKARLREFEKQLAESALITFDEPAAEEKKSSALAVQVVNHEPYIENMKDVLTMNDIKFKSPKKKKKDHVAIKKGTLKSYVQRKSHVTTPLVNSGIFVTLAGASIPEIIQMNNIRANSTAEVETKKLAFIKKHLVDSSVGSKMSITELAKLIYYKDIQTLYFNLFIGTFPEENEFPVSCENKQCGHNLKLKIHAADLVLNAKEFEEVSKYTLYKNSTVKDVLAQSALTKEKMVRINPDLVIGFRNPSIFDVLELSSLLEDLTRKGIDLAQYERVAGYLMYMTYLAVRDPEDDEFTQYNYYSDLHEMLEILLVLDEDDLDTVDEEVEEYTTRNTVRYGFKKYTCPRCGRVHKEREMPMDELLFTFSQVRTAMRQVEKLNKKEESLKSE